jgi:hypothetical protein
MRVCALWLTVWVHIKTFGGMKKFTPGSLSYKLYLVTNSLFSTSINALLLISGYFGVNSAFNPRRLILLWFSIWTYTGIGTVVAKAIGWIGDWPFFWYITRFPILQGAYAFHTEYMVLQLIAPALHMAATALPKLRFQLACVFMWVLEINSCSVEAFLFSFHEGRGISHFVCVYLVGCYFRFHGNPFPIVVTWVLFICLVWLQCYVQTVGLKWVFTYKYTKFLEPVHCAFRPKMKFSGGVSLVLSYLLLLVHETVSITGLLSKPICFFGAHVFAIYCIHAHQAFLMPFPQRLFRAGEWQTTSSECFISLARFTSTTVIACVAIDLFRDVLFAFAEMMVDNCVAGWKKSRLLWFGKRVHRDVLVKRDGRRERVPLGRKRGFIRLFGGL